MASAGSAPADVAAALGRASVFVSIARTDYASLYCLHASGDSGPGTPAAVILQAKSLGFGRIEDFPFLDPPRPESVRDWLQHAVRIGAIDQAQELTELGLCLARLPVRSTHWPHYPGRGR